MEVNVKELENSQVELEITVPAAELDKAYEAAYKKVAAKVNIPGFRKGKAPKKIVERTVGQEYILDEAVEAIAPKKFFEAIKEKEIDIVTRPEFDVTTKELGKEEGVHFGGEHLDAIVLRQVVEDVGVLQFRHFGAEDVDVAE